jgi:cyclase
MLRVIAKLDVKGPNLIKSMQFDGHRVLGTAEQFAATYYSEGIDEIIYNDTVASLYQRKALIEVIKKTAQKSFVPLTVAGGIRSVDDVREVLRSGADKVAINTAAVLNPQLLKDCVKAFGSQCIVSSIEVFRQDDGRYEVWVDNGRQPTTKNFFDWVKEVQDLGVGEILLHAIRRDGMGKGYDLEMSKAVSEMVSVPVILSCGAGKKEHLALAIKEGCADAVCASSLFHYNYLKPAPRQTMSYDSTKLRMGQQIDSGNIDFLNGGFGGFREFTVEPCSVGAAKDYLLSQGISVRHEVIKLRTDTEELWN